MIHQLSLECIVYRNLTMLSVKDVDNGFFATRSIIDNKSIDKMKSLDTTSLSLVVRITSATRNDEAQTTECMSQILLHSANVLPHPMLNYFFETDFLAARIAMFFREYSRHFFPHLYPRD